MTVIKRNGAEVVFDIGKIVAAVTKANEAYAKLKAGESFETVMAEYNQDTEQTEKGRLISNQYVSDYDWSNEVKAEFATLKIGEYSKVVQDDEGCHILYYLGDEPSKIDGKISEDKSSNNGK